jgi:hypothetical protein
MPPEASSSIDPAAGAPTEAAEVRSDVWSLTAEQATEVLQQAAAEYRQRQLPISTETPGDAARMLASLQNDPEVARKALSGDIATLDRLRDLAEQSIGNTDAIADQPLFDTSVGDQSAPRAGLISWATDARARGFSDEAIYHFVNGGTFTRETVATAQYWLPRMERDPGLLYPDWPPDRDYQLEAFRWIISAGTGDTP